MWDQRRKESEDQGKGNHSPASPSSSGVTAGVAGAQRSPVASYSPGNPLALKKRASGRGTNIGGSAGDNSQDAASATEIELGEIH